MKTVQEILREEKKGFRMKSLSEQVGGNHYTKFKIQPIEYSMANGLDACQHSVVKYITRFRDKGGISDLKKAKHMIDLLIDMEYAGECASKQNNNNE